MPTFKNTSSEVFQDGDLVVSPGESFSTTDEARCIQLRGQYAWQFDESDGEDAVSEADLKERAAHHGVREIRSASHVQVDEEGAQADVVGSPQEVQADVQTEDDSSKKKGKK